MNKSNAHSENWYTTEHEEFTATLDLEKNLPATTSKWLSLTCGLEESK